MHFTIHPISYKNLKWYDFTEPSEELVQFLAKKFKFHPLDLEDCLTENQRPKIDEYDRYLFLIFHFPVFNKNTQRITTAELDIFIGQNFVITIHRGVLKPLSKIRTECAQIIGQRKYFSRGTGYFLYKLTSELFDYCFPIFDKLSKTSGQLEHAVFDKEGTKASVREIMLLKKNIIALRRIIGPERPVISSLEHKNKKFLPENLEVYFDDVVDKIEKLWHSLGSLKEVAETLQDANESLTSHRTEDTIKILTVFSVILLPLTLVSGIFGMNVWLPFGESTDAWIWISVGMFLIATSMFWFFRWKKWV
jgi:magnesium transporter